MATSVRASGGSKSRSAGTRTASATATRGRPRRSRPRPRARGRAAARDTARSQDSRSSSTAGVRPERRSSKIRIASPYRQMGRSPLWTFVRWTDVPRAHGRMSVATMGPMPQSRCMRIRLPASFFAAASRRRARHQARPQRQRRPPRRVGSRLLAEAHQQPFAPFGDTSRLQPCSGRLLRGGQGSWQLQRRVARDGNEPWKVSGAATRARCGSRRARAQPRR